MDGFSLLAFLYIAHLLPYFFSLIANEGDGVAPLPIYPASLGLLEPSAAAIVSHLGRVPAATHYPR